MKIKIDEGGYMPKYAHQTDAGMDLRTPELIVVPARGSTEVDLRIHVQIPPGYYGKVESKSGIMFVNTVFAPGGIIDSGYTGSIKVKLVNFSDNSKKFERGDKVAQLIVIPYLHADLRQVPDLEETDRGSDGFGSTGR